MAGQKNEEKPAEGNSRFGGLHLAMLACCAVMVMPIAVVVFSGAGFGLDSLSLSTLAPLLLCVGGHVVLHKMMGKGCHGDKTTTEAPDFSKEELRATVPVAEMHVPAIKRR
ncbi:DUF2933 domain-containing protein [Seohaeicola saemankumensis]|nr:DUF2933 domain-containing protein [Seohaeicola saemankumensis]MCA0871407.1 DUF2933 domain-containing protein [Seohaeicola saemankumensis]